MSTVSPKPSLLAVALGLALGPVVFQGFSRFAYALLLPPMRADLGWSYTQAGALNGANAVGYILGALLAAPCARLVGTRAAFLLGLGLTALLVLATGFSGHYPYLVSVRLGTGLSSAVGYVVGSALAAQLPFRQNAIFHMGPGIGVVLSGLLVPALLHNQPARHWPWGWLCLGAVALAAVPPALRAAAGVSHQRPGEVRHMSGAEFHLLLPSLASYTLFGAGYAGYTTFVIAQLRSHGFPAWVPVWFWIVLGLVAVASIFVWRIVLDVLPGGRGPALVSLVTLAGTVPLLLEPGVPLVFLSAVLYGAGFLAAGPAVLGVGRRVLPREAWTGAFAVLTTGFALGQSVGPVLSGWLADLLGDLSKGLWAAPLLLGLSAASALFQQHVDSGESAGGH